MIFNFDIIGVIVYSIGALLWILIWHWLVGFRELAKVKLLRVSFYGALFVFAVNIALSKFAIISPYKTELAIYSYVEQNATTIAGLSLAIAVFVVIEFKGIGFLLKGPRSRMFLSLLLWSFLLSVVGCLPLYWMPPKKGWLMALRHIKTVPFTYSLFILASAIILFIHELKNVKDDGKAPS